jgi:Na+-driven multidrug efflux pump
VIVQRLTPDVAGGGRIEAASAPSYPWWQPERVRWVLAGVWWYLLIAGAIAALVVAWRLRRRPDSAG